MDLPLVSVLLCVAAVLGDTVKYGVGYRVGLKVLTSETSRLLNKDHLMRAHRFYGRYGGKAIFLVRFVPIIRTFAPFVAGIGQMSSSPGALCNVTGGNVWVDSFLLAGRFFADLRVVKGAVPLHHPRDQRDLGHGDRYRVLARGPGGEAQQPRTRRSRRTPGGVGGVRHGSPSATYPVRPRRSRS